MLNSNALRTIQRVLALLVLVQAVPAVGGALTDARRDLTAMRYAKAEAALVQIAKSSAGDAKQEALYLLAGLKTSVSEAEIIYQEAAQMNPSSEWGAASQVEVAKIRYALGNYREASEILRKCSACLKSDEASYFEGLSAVMLKRYEEAKDPLARVKSERYRSAAGLALADAETGLNHRDEACRRYKAMAQEAAGPTAVYRHGECLEEQGDVAAAIAVFEEVGETFEETPEALLAAEKLDALRAAGAGDDQNSHGSVAADGEHAPSAGSSFTLQFGSFHDRANAIKLASEIKRTLPGVRIDSDLLNFREVHRVRFGYFKTRAEAERKAEEIARQTGERCTIMALP